jgi:hypothetical protein
VAFDLLQDFWRALPKLDIAGIDLAHVDREYVDVEIRERLTTALETLEGSVSRYDFIWLEKKANSTVREDEFCIALDHGIYFSKADFLLDVSRTAANLRRTGSQYLTRLPRELLDMPSQLAALSSRLATSRKRRVVIADDGLATGQTLSMVIQRCRDYDIEVRRAIVCCNNTELTRIDDSVKISSIVRHSPGRPWLNERDLYWGLPRSGLTLATKTKASRSYSIPYSLTTRLVIQRIGVEDEANEFRISCLRANRKLWAMFEKAAGHPLFFEDCPPLRFFPDVLGYRDKRVVDLLTELIDGTIVADDLEEITDR